MKRLALILGIFLVSSAYAGELANKVWIDNLVIDWGNGTGPPKVALLHGSKVTKGVLEKATVLQATTFEWNGKAVPSLWVYHLPDEMIGEHFIVTLFSPWEVAGVGSTRFHTEEAIMITRVVKASGWKWRRPAPLDANGVVGRLYRVSAGDMKCFGSLKVCKGFQGQIAAAGKKAGK